jgi:nucleoside diphosphate kinase
VYLICSGPVIAMVLEKEDCVEGWRQLLGPANPKRAKEEMPQR